MIRIGQLRFWRVGARGRASIPLYLYLLKHLNIGQSFELSQEVTECYHQSNTNFAASTVQVAGMQSTLRYIAAIDSARYALSAEDFGSASG
jgi:hypothetical protein